MAFETLLSHNYVTAMWVERAEEQREIMRASHVTSVLTTGLCHCSMKAARDDVQTHVCAYASRSLHLTLKFGFHIIFTFYKIFFFLVIKNMQKSLLACRSYKNR